MRHGKRELRNAASKGWGGIEASPDHRGCEMLHAHNMVHIDRKGVHGSYVHHMCCFHAFEVVEVAVTQVATFLRQRQRGGLQ